MQPAEITITPAAGPLDAVVAAPPSKAFTMRTLFVAALAEGETRLEHPLLADDQAHALTALQELGATFRRDGDALLIHGVGGAPEPQTESFFAGQSGLTARFLCTLLTLAPRNAKLVIDGHPLLRQRPFGFLVGAIKSLGGRARELDAKGVLPIRIRGGGLKGGRTEVPGDIHTQFLSALLLVAPYARDDVSVTCVGTPRNSPYLDITLEVMRSFGAQVERDGYRRFTVTAGRGYTGRTYRIERDHLVAAYFYTAAAITGGRIRVTGLSPASRQAEKLFPALLRRMGCAVWPQPDGMLVEGGELTAIEVDVRDAGELLLPLAVVAAFAKGTSRLLGVGHLAHREWERLAAVVDGLEALGIRSERQGDVLAVSGGRPYGGVIESRGDFRVAMAFAVAGLGARGTRIRNPGCVTRVFPRFYERLDEMVGNGEAS